jgi:hypothetical protein
MLMQWNRPVAAQYARCAACPTRASPQGQLITQHNGQPLASSIIMVRLVGAGSPGPIRLCPVVSVVAGYGSVAAAETGLCGDGNNPKEEEAGAALSMKQANRKCVGILRRNFTRESISQPLYCCCFDLLR